MEQKGPKSWKQCAWVNVFSLFRVNETLICFFTLLDVDVGTFDAQRTNDPQLIEGAPAKPNLSNNLQSSDPRGDGYD